MLQVGVLVAFFVASAIYAAPSAIAIMKGHRRWAIVVAINILLGWSVVGWLVALAIALGVAPRRPAWTKWTRKKRARAKAKPLSADDVMVRTDLDDPPPISEDVYASWLDQGAAIPGTREPHSS